MVNMGDHMNGHPGTDSAYVPRFDSAVLPPETLSCLKGIFGGKGDNSEYEEQQNAEKAQLGAFTQAIQLLLTLSFLFGVIIPWKFNQCPEHDILIAVRSLPLDKEAIHANLSYL
jgi:hypothetical protein